MNLNIRISSTFYRVKYTDGMYSQYTCEMETVSLQRKDTQGPFRKRVKKPVSCLKGSLNLPAVEICWNSGSANTENLQGRTNAYSLAVILSCYQLVGAQDWHRDIWLPKFAIGLKLMTNFLQMEISVLPSSTTIQSQKTTQKLIL